MVSIVRQTWEERYNMYMKHTKEELASMLAESAKITDRASCKEFENDDKVEATYTTILPDSLDKDKQNGFVVTSTILNMKFDYKNK